MSVRYNYMDLLMLVDRRTAHVVTSEFGIQQGVIRRIY